MAYLQIDNFQYGMDRRRRRFSGVPGTLWTGKNVVITRGGDVQRVKKFVQTHTLPAGTFGFARSRDQLFVFGSADLAASMPAGIQYQRLQAPSTPTMTRIVDAKAYDGNIYAIAEYDDGNVYHFYDGTRVSDWETVADAAADFSFLAEYLAAKLSADENVTAEAFGSAITLTADVPGTGFTISKSTTDNGGTADQDITLTTVQANVAEVSETRATGSVEITGGSSKPGINLIEQVTVGGVDLLSASVNWTGSNGSTAVALATAVNNRTATHGYVATVTSATVTLTAAAGTGADPNGDTVAVTIPATSNVTVTTADISGGVAAVDPVAQVVTAEFTGTVEPTDLFTITLNGVDYLATPRASAMGSSIYVRKGRIYCTAGSLIRYCVLNNPTDWTTTTTSADAGFINVAQDSEGSRRLIGIGDYNGQSAVFSETAVFIYSLNADTSNDGLVSILPNTGTRAAQSIESFGNSDVFYLDASGVRSLRPRDSSGSATWDDVGTVIDPFIQEWVASLTEADRVLAQTAIEPFDDRFMLLVGGRIFIFSRFPSVKITAWTYYEPSDITPTHILRTARRLYVRDATGVYLYGGADGEQYDDGDTNQPVVELPFMGAKDDAALKDFTGYDIAGLGTWKLEVVPNPNDESQVATVGIVDKITYPLAEARMNQRTSHMAWRLTCQSDGLAEISAMAIHYKSEPKG